MEKSIKVSVEGFEIVSTLLEILAETEGDGAVRTAESVVSTLLEILEHGTDTETVVLASNRFNPS